MYEDQIEAGITFLNERYPGWQNDLPDLELIEMGEPCNCVLGQITGSYWQEVEEASGHDRWSTGAYEWAVAHGFDIDAEDDGTSYESLTEEWRMRLEEGYTLAGGA